jgi:hypothetical protein
MRLVMRNPAGRVDPRFAAIVRMARTRGRLIFLVTGSLLMVISVMLPSGAFTVAFVSGMVVLGLSAPSALPWTPTTAMVGAWEWLHKGKGDHR